MRTPVRKWENRVVSKRSTFELHEKSATGKDESLEDSATCLTPDVIAREIDSQISLCSPFGLPVHVVRSSDLHCRRPSSRPQPILARSLARLFDGHERADRDFGEEFSGRFLWQPNAAVRCRIVRH